MSDLLDWKNLGFSYIKTDYRFIARWKDGKWDNGELTTDSTLHIHEGSSTFSVRIKTRNVCKTPVIAY